MKRIALVSGFWGQNIGNAFFNIGGKYILEQMFPDDRVEFIQDQPGYRTFHKQHTGNPRNDFGLLQHLKADFIVLQGPLLTTTFRALWEPTLRALKARGTKVILLSAAMFRYTEEERRQNREFLKWVEPVIFSTRDAVTYEAFKDVCPRSWSGIDSAFFVPRAYEPFALACPPYITLNYDRFPEPDVTVSEPGGTLPPGKYDAEFEALGRKWAFHYPRLQEKLAHRGKIQSYLGAFGDRRKLPAAIAGYTVVRPEHRFNPHMTWKIYRQPNAVASDEPWTYFTVYAGAELTLSDRVHACVATLAYGRPAMLYKHTKRAYLFDRLGLAEIGKGPVTLPPETLRREQEAQLDFLRRAAREVAG